ncbi:amidohydrolase [Corynebacterium sp. ES2730-CONJ]|uniref:amidohydrolase n=1 Tax=Corynebacterium sp. ES2730-CONJ TaxID=2973941 RepID=UPI00216AD4C0|nr:amidohydrolase [Corynebacterium sp. ES2730-CONJ]MCS4531431.1 amidohydrolase [Corynebacterium sp. ES2730-CONJ]
MSAWCEEHHEELMDWRRHVHMYPELSNEEFNTTAFIAEKLREGGLEPTLFPRTGLVVDIVADPESRMGSVAFRADIDALPIHEHTNAPYSSRHDNTMHACGHDIHITVALGFARALIEAQRQGLVRRNVRIIFQPAEEAMGSGAPEIVKLGVLSGVERIYALHAEPKIRTGTVGLKVGALTSAGDLVEIRVSGPGGHSSRPHLTSDVVYALSKLVIDLPGLLSRRVDASTSTVLVFGAIHAGRAGNAIPETGSVCGTVRTGRIEVWHELQPLLEELIAQVLAPTGCEHEIIYTRGVPPVINDVEAVEIFTKAAQMRDRSSTVPVSQSAGGEDFSWYLQTVPGAMARLGCWDGTHSPGDLHKATMLADAASIPVGVQLFAGVLEQEQR